MSRFIQKQGFTLIELMVVIVIIGVLASLAIPRFTEASIKAKVAEAPRVIASFESAYLAGVAEKGETGLAMGDIIFQIPQSKWFTYAGDPKSGDLTGLTATAKQSMGVINIDDYFKTSYTAETFEHSFSQCTGSVDLTPAQPNEDDEAKAAREAANAAKQAEYNKKCNAITKYIPNF